MLRIFISILFLGQFFILNAQDQSDVIVHGESPLNWKMFSVRNKPSGNQKAFSYAGIAYSVRESERKIIVQFLATFNPKQSWVMTGAMSADLLSHEQVLFDLTELYARKMRKETQAYLKEKSGVLPFQEVLDGVRNIFKRLNNELFDQQHLYNSETNNGRNKEYQRMWAKRIQEGLQSLEDYASPVITS